MSKYKIGVLGDRESVLGFKALGLEVFPAEDPAQARTLLHRLAKEDYAILYITETLAAAIPEEMARYRKTLTPAVILIPGKEGSLGLGMNNVKAAIEQAVGADIL